MTGKDDDELQKWLAAYQVAEADQDLLNTIIYAAKSTSQQKKFAWNFLDLITFEFMPWKAAAAFVVVALLGFWIGAALPNNAASPIPTQQALSINKSDLNKIIFGSKTLKEVTL